MARSNFELIAWSIFNQRTGIQIDTLTFEQAWKIVAAADLTTRQSMLIWHDGLTSWKPPTDFEDEAELIEEVLKRPVTYPRLPNDDDQKRAEEQSRVSIFEAGEENTDFALEANVAEEKREHYRFKQRYVVEIESDTGSFTTHTADISLGGMRLENRIPTEIPDPFVARMRRANGEFIDVRCSITAGVSRDRVRFLLNESNTPILRTWILETPEDGDQA